MLFLFVVLVGAIFLLGLLSQKFLFAGRLEPAFIGALVGASGTIFAACIAYTAASKSLEMATKTAEDNALQRAENERNQKRWQLQNARNELKTTRDALAYMDKFLTQFDGAADTGSRDYVTCLNDIYRSGGVPFYSAPVTQAFQSRLQEMTVRFNNMQGPMGGVVNRPADEVVQERAAMNRIIRERVAEAKTLRSDIDEDLRRREREVDAAERQQQL
jgi:hypothetical protein